VRNCEITIRALWKKNVRLYADQKWLRVIQSYSFGCPVAVFDPHGVNYVHEVEIYAQKTYITKPFAIVFYFQCFENKNIGQVRLNAITDNRNYWLRRTDLSQAFNALEVVKRIANAQDTRDNKILMCISSVKHTGDSRSGDKNQYAIEH